MGNDAACIEIENKPSGDRQLLLVVIHVTPISSPELRSLMRAVSRTAVAHKVPTNRRSRLCPELISVWTWLCSELISVWTCLCLYVKDWMRMELLNSSKCARRPGARTPRTTSNSEQVVRTYRQSKIESRART